MIARTGHLERVRRLLRQFPVVEIERTDSPRVTPSMRSAIDALRLDSLEVVHAGTETYPRADGIRALSLARLQSDVRPLRP